MDDREKYIRLKLRNDFSHYAQKCLKIRDKNGVISPFRINKAQQYIHDEVEKQKALTGKIRAIILKGRQQGCSTYIEGRFYWRVTHNKGLRAFILTHALDATNNLFEMAQRYHQYCPAPVRPLIQASNSKELYFGGLDSGYKIGTAENKSVGRSSTIQLFHGSECAFWSNASEHAKGIMQAIPGGLGTEVFLESTANGLGNYFHEQWQMAESGLSDFIPIFIPWFWQDEYVKVPAEDFARTEEENELVNYYGLADTQLAWRRAKIIELTVLGSDGTKSFKQEYPCTPIEAFQTTGEDNYISPDLVMKARKTKVEAIGPLVVGVDPAREGNDRTAIMRRQSRKAFGLETYTKKNTMEVAGIVNRIIIEENPVKVFIDTGGLGAGVYDRLVELGFGKIVVAVNSASTPLNQKKYANKRAEMWGLTKEWLFNEPVEIPDLNELHADLCSPKYGVDSNNRLLMEKKALMKKRGVRSSDTADALGLTFAYPLNLTDDVKHEKLASRLTSVTRKVASLRKTI